MARGGALLIAGVLLLAGAAAWVALHDTGAGDPPPAVPGGSVSETVTAVGHEPHRDRVDVAVPAPARPHDLPRGTIRVVDAAGSVAMASVYTTVDPVWSREDAQFVSGTGKDGLIGPEHRDSEAQAFLWAFAPGRCAGPDAVDPAGQTLVLGPGTCLDVSVRRPDGAPLAGAMCGAEDWRARAVTDAEGHATLSGFPAGIEVEAVAGVVGTRSRATGRVALPADGSPERVTLVVEPGSGPFVHVTISGDVAPTAAVELEIARDAKRATDVELRGDDPPLLVSLRQDEDGAAALTARALGTRPARRSVAGLERGTTTPVELRLVAGGVPRRGRVLNADGTPARQVAVDLAAEILELGTDATDDDGWFDVRTGWIGETILALRPREACSAAVTLDRDVDELVLRLTPGATLRGVVRDATSGRPIRGAQVRIAFGPGEWDDDWDVEADDHGAYRVSGIPPGTFVMPLVEDSPRAAPPEEQWRLTGGHHRSTPARAKLVREGHAHVVEGAETITHDLVAIANRGGECTFRVVLPAGAAVPEQLVVEQSWKGARGWRNERRFERPEDGDTSFTLFLEEGTHHLRVTAPGLSGEGPEIVVAGDGPLPDVEIVMTPRRRVRARLVAADGAPVTREGVAIRMAVSGPNGGRGSGEGRTDASGVADLTDDAPAAGKVDADDTFVVLTLDGEGIYVASPWGEEANLRVPGPEWARRLREDTTEPWVLVVPIVEPPRLALHVVDPAGHSVAGVPVRWKRSFDSDFAVGESDADGLVEVALSDEYDDLEFQATGEWVGATKFQRLRDGKSETTITVDRRRTVRVRFVDPPGNALPDQRVIAFVPGVWTEGPTDEHGCIELDLPASDTAFDVRARGFWPPDDVAAPAGATEIDAVIEPLFPVTFRAVLAAGLERPDKVFVRIGSGNAPHGEFESVDVAPDVPIEARIALPRRPFPVIVTVPDPRFGGSAEYTGVEDVVTVRVERLPLQTVVLRVEGSGSRPLPDLDVHVVAGAYPGVLDEALTTDADGHVTLRLPARIMRRISVEADGYLTATFDHDPDAATDDPVRVVLIPRR